MLGNRKRKASQDKSSESSKSPRLKVSNKIFRSPASSKPSCDAKTKISNLLPEGYDSIILTASTKPEENSGGNEALYGCVRLPIITREDALMWVKKFELKTSTSYRSQKSWKNDLKAGLFKRKFLCDYQNPDECDGEVYSCKACIIFTIKDAKEIQTNPDYYLRDYPSQVIIQFCHNHDIDPEEHVKHPYSSGELRTIFDKYFANGHSPFSALTCHKCNLHSLYGAEFYDVVSNSAICPSYNWCVREYENLFGGRFVEPQVDELIDKLTAVVSQYNTKCDSECAFFTHKDVELLSLCTPFMKSVFTSGFAEDLITVRSFCTPKTSLRRQKLVLFLCHTPIGSLPFGVVVSCGEDAGVFCEGIRALLKMLGAPLYSPKAIITDEHSLISKCLRRSFPNSQVVFNEFQMLQSVWRILRLVCEDDNEEFQALYNLFLVTLNSGCEGDFKENFDSLVIYAERYPKLGNFMKYFKLRANAYVLYARPKVEFNTDVLNYTDSGTVILQDVSIKYRNFFNSLQLFDFLTKTYVEHYERKLTKITGGDLKGFFKTNFYVPLGRISNFTCEKVTDTEFVVVLDGIKFFVNAELDTCTCQVGVHGGSCVHQFIVENNVGLVPECYTPLDDDMLGVLKGILAYKDSTPEEVRGGFKELEAAISDDNDGGACESLDPPQDVENLGPVDEIYLAPSQVTDSFTEDDMSPMALSEFDDVPQGGKDDDSGRNLEEVDEENQEICHNEESFNILEVPTVEEDMGIYGKENEKKTAEIAEFLTNLPDTNKSHCHVHAVQDSEVPLIENFDEQMCLAQETEVTSEGVVIMKDDEFFTQYKLMEDGVLSVEEEQVEFQETPDFEDNSLVMVSPDDLFAEALDKTGSRINVLSTVVIKPPGSQEILAPPSVPLNLDSIKHKTLRNVKQQLGSEAKLEGGGEKDVIQLYCNQADELKVKTETINETTVKTAELTDCDPEQLAKENVTDLIEIDSDELEELASQEHDTNVPLGLETNDLLQKSPLKLVTLKDVPPTIFPSKPFPAGSDVKPIPLRDFMMSPPSSVKPQSGLLNTAFNQLTDLASRNNFKGKNKDLDGGTLASIFERLSAKGISIRKATEADKSKQIAPVGGASKIPDVHNDDDDSQWKKHHDISDDSSSSSYSDTTFTDSDDLEHFSDCRTSCSEIHSELEGLKDELSDYDFYESIKVENERRSERDFIERHIGYLKNPFVRQPPKLLLPIKTEVDSDDEYVKPKLPIKLFKQGQPNVSKFIGKVDAKVLKPSKYPKIPPVVRQDPFTRRNKLTETISGRKSLPPRKPIKEPKNGSVFPRKGGATIKRTTMSKHAQELESILTDGAAIPNVDRPHIKVEPPIFMNDELSFLFNDSRFETIIENSSEDFPCEWNAGIDLSNVKFDRKNEPNKRGKQTNKPPAKKLARELKELKRLAEVFTREKRRGKVVNPLSVVKNRIGNPVKTKRIEIKLEKDANAADTPPKRNKKETKPVIKKETKPVIKKEPEDPIFDYGQPIKEFKPTYSSSKELAVVKPFRKTSYTSATNSPPLWDNKPIQKTSLVTSTPLKPSANYTKTFWETDKAAINRKTSLRGNNASKKSVSYADDVATITSESDSDVSEIRLAPVGRPKKKLGRPPKISKQQDSLRSPFSLSQSQLKKQKRTNRNDSRRNEKKLIVRLERIREIEAMCRDLGAVTPRSSRYSSRSRKGYKELLENAKRLKKL